MIDQAEIWQLEKEQELKVAQFDYKIISAPLQLCWALQTKSTSDG